MEKIFYTIEMAKKLRTLKPPVKGLILDVRARTNYLALTVYESNIMEYNETQRMAIMDYLLKCREFIMSYGTPCEIEGMKYTHERAREQRKQEQQRLWTPE
jgi:predicted methyltransferase